MRALFVTIIIVAIFIGRVEGQQVAKMMPDGTGYLEHLPPDYYSNPTKKYPLLLFLHGQGERGDGTPAGLEKVKANGPPYEINRGSNMCFTVDGKEECFIVISPQLSTSQGSWYAYITEDIFNYVYANYRIDPDRVYLTGLSLGGGGTDRYAGSSFNQPNELAAIATCAGWGYGSDPCIIAEGNISMWAFHGDSDPTINYSWDIDFFNAIKACNPASTADMKFTTYPGVGHNSWWMSYLTDHSWHNPNVYEWLLMQKRSSSGTPTANAGSNKSITLPTNSITLTGSGSDPDGTIRAYNWTKINGPNATLSNTTSNSLTVSGMLAGTYTFRLTVTDNDGNTATDDVQVIVLPEPPNQTPTANAGTDQVITLPQNMVTISGSGSDNDGSVTGYGWTQISGPSSAGLSGQSTATLVASSLIEGVYIFRLTVTDNKGATGLDEVKITVNPAIVNDPPVANAGNDILLTLPVNSTNINGSGSDPDGTVKTYSWTQVSGPASATLTNINKPTLSVAGLIEGIYTFELTVTDDGGESDTDQVKVTVEKANAAPIANAGSDQVINLPTSTATINGAGSDADGTISSYNWTQISGPSTATLSNNLTPTLTVSGLIEGSYIFSLEVTDNDGATSTDAVRITVAAAAVNQAPVANAGTDKSITLPVNSVTLSGSGNDTDGSISTWQWTKVSGPANATIVTSDAASTDITDLIAGTYTFRLTVTDNQGDTGSDLVVVTVSPATVNNPPVVNAGTDRQITIPITTIDLNGSANDSDGSIATTIWTQVSGPNSAIFSGETTLNLAISGLIQGTYVFKLTVTDDEGASASDQITVKVNVANIGPSVNTGVDINLLLPDNTVAIKGSASDPDGTIDVIAWTQISGPSTANLAGASTLNVTISSLIEGTYTFRLTVTDNDGKSNFDEVNVNVSALNQLPVVTTGLDKTITLPTSTVTFLGNATDNDGTITSYSWIQVSGPTTSTLTNQNTQNLTVSDLKEGIYVYKLTATDNEGGTSTDEVSVTVLPEIINSAPTANAGNDIVLTLPVSSTNLSGSGSDNDGTIETYQWTKISGSTVTMTNVNNATLSIKDLLEGVYVFELRVTDDDGATGKDQVTVTVNPEIVNTPPVANAGNDVILVLPTNTVTLFGSGSDNDGSVLTYSWTKDSGGNATLSGDKTPNLSLTNLEEGVYHFKLTVTDEDNASDEDITIVTVSPATTNKAPISNAGTDRTIQLPTSSVTVTGSASDTDGGISEYLWTKVSGPSAFTINNSDKPQMTLSELVEGTYVFRLTVTDDKGATGMDEVKITVLAEEVNVAPVANAGSNVTIKLPVNQVTLYGIGTDSKGGSIVGYKWSFVSGPAGHSFDNPNRSTVTISGLTEGKYIFRLTVTDNDGATASDNIQITVNPQDANIVPIVNAGVDKTIYMPVNSTELEGTAFDPDGTDPGYQWIKVSGGTATLENSQTLKLSLKDLVEGVYVFRLTVTDERGASVSDQAIVFVQPATVNQPPVVNAGADVNLILPDNGVTLTATVSDPENDLASVTWISLANTPENMTGENTQELILSDLTEGFYSFRFTATDGDGLKSSDIVNVTVGKNEQIPPEIVMMPDVDMEQTDEALDLWAEAYDDGEVVSVKWEQLLGPPVAMSNPGASINTTIGWQAGNYEFRFTATDDDGLSSAASVEITVLASSGSETAYPIKIITPNGDYDNERWILDPDISKHQDCKLVIFNKQGQEVYSKTGYANDWNATLNGKQLDEGVYYYVLDCGANDGGTLTGSITVIR